MAPMSPKGEALVRAGRRAYQPTGADRERLLGALRAQLGKAALPPDVGSLATATSAGRTMWWLMSALVLGVGIVGGTIFFAGRPETNSGNPRPEIVAPIAAPAQVFAPPVAPSVGKPTGGATTLPAPDPPALPAAVAYRPKDRLAAEVALLSRATRDLRGDRPTDALKALDEYRRKFPKGLLSDEHDAARAQTLCALRRFEEANARLAELPPRSPLAARARQFCDVSSAAR